MSPYCEPVHKREDATVFATRAEATRYAEAYCARPGIEAIYHVSGGFWSRSYRIHVNITAPLRMVAYLRLRDDA